jgi:phosphatidylinositol alpha-1,6-mannosyltransferase
VRRTLLLTNDFPPRVGGIQSYVHALATRLPASDLVVLASDYAGSAEFDAAQPFPVVRYPTGMLLPTPAVARRAGELIAEHGLTGVWYGAAAPLALLTPRLRRDGIERTVACTYGHEVGWSMLPGSRQALRRIGNTNDIITFISRFSRRRISAALGPHAALEPLVPGVDSDEFRPDEQARATVRARYGLGDAPVVVCVSRLVPRKGQDMLIRAWPTVLRDHPDARLLIVGDGSYDKHLRRMAEASEAAGAIVFTGRAPVGELPAHYAAGDVFAMPCRTRGAGLDVEGLGIVFLEASACGLPVIAGDSGGAPEAVLPEQTGIVLPGRDVPAIAKACSRLLGDPALRRAWGQAGRRWVQPSWTWQAAADRLVGLLNG